MAQSNLQLQEDINHVREHGYVIIENAFTRDEAEAAKWEIARLSGHTPKPGRNAFEGLNTNRIYSLLNKYAIASLFADCHLFSQDEILRPVLHAPSGAGLE